MQLKSNEIAPAVLQFSQVLPHTHAHEHLHTHTRMRVSIGAS